MNKRQLQDLLDQSDAGLMKLAHELRLARSTVSRWRDEVPAYAVFYAFARIKLSPEDREEIARAVKEAVDKDG